MEPLERFIEANPDDVLPIDQDDIDDIQACAKYIKEIYAYLLQSEKQYHLSPDFLTRQKYLSADDRTILYDWISRAHCKFNLANESFFHFVTLCDKLLERIQLFPYDQKLVGIAVLLICSKFEQSYIPSLRHYVQIMEDQNVRYVNCELCLQKYGENFRRYAAIGEEYETPDAVLQSQNSLPPCAQCMRGAIMMAEEQILHALDFHLSIPTSLGFLRRFAKICDMKARDRYIAFYLGELCAMDDQMVVKWSPSQIATGCIAMTRRLTRKPSWSQELVQYSGFLEEEVREVLQDVSAVLKSLALSPKVKYIRRKYAQQERFYAVSVLIEQVVGQVVQPAK